ncbi:MAG: DUF131 domain-containing protein [Thermoplasmata archaeon]
MRIGLLGSVTAFAAGVILIVLSVIEGAASVSLLVVIPVITGTSLIFLLGVVLLIVGFLSLPLAFVGIEDEVSPTRLATTTPPAKTAGGAGGFVLIGPVPIVFGSWKGISKRAQRWLVVLGAALFILAFVAFVLFVR